MKVYVMIKTEIFKVYDANQVILPTQTGLLGVLDNHGSFMVALQNGTMLIQEKDNDWVGVAILEGGALLVKDYPFEKNVIELVGQPPIGSTCLLILVDNAKSTKDLDPIQTKEAYELAKIQLAKADSKKNFLLAERAVKRTRTFYQATKTLPQ